MTIGTSDGQQYEDQFQHAVASIDSTIVKGDAEKPADALKPELGTQLAMNDKFVPMNPMTPAYNNPGGHEHIAHIENPGRAVPVHKSTKESPESIYSSAIKTPSGEVYMGINHADAYSKIPTSDPIHGSNDAQWSSAQGYVTSKGRFVSRLEAKPIAEANKQIHTNYESRFGLLSEEMDPKNVENIQKLLIEYLGEKSKK